MTRSSESEDLDVSKSLAQKILDNEALKRAAGSNDLAELKIASEIQKTVAPVPANRANVALIIALCTLIFQIIQFGWSTWLQTRSQEDAQWRDAVKTVALANGPMALTGALNIQTFYRSPRYGGDAQELVAASLPFFDNAEAFDQIAHKLKDNLSQDNELLLYDVNRNIALAYGDDYAKLSEVYTSFEPPADNGGRTADQFEIILSDRLPATDNGESTVSPVESLGPLNKDIKLREWEIDSLTAFTLEYWHEHGRDVPESATSPSAAATNVAPDLSHTIFRLDENKPVNMTHLNLSDALFVEAYFGRADLSYSLLQDSNFTNADLSHANLTGTHLEGATLTNADLSHAVLTGANLQGANIDRADFSSADISGLDLSKWTDICNARTAKFRDSTMRLLKARHLMSSSKSSCPLPTSETKSAQ